MGYSQESAVRIEVRTIWVCARPTSLPACLDSITLPSTLEPRGTMAGRWRAIGKQPDIGSIGKMNAVFPPWPIREFRDRSDGIPESGREDSIFRGAGAFFGRTNEVFVTQVEVPIG